MIQTICAKAPLRLGFGGGGTDVSPYCDQFGGVVLNATIGLFARVTLEPRTDGQLVLASADQQKPHWQGVAKPHRDVPEHVRLHKGVWDHFAARTGQRPGVTLTTSADSPPGSGLGTSSALVVALVEAMRRFNETILSPQEIAELAYRIERQDLDLAGGHQDQYTAAFGGFNMMVFGAEDQVKVSPLTISEATQAQLESSIVLYFTGVSRHSATIIDEQTANMKDAQPRSLAGLDALKAGALDMQAALADGDLLRFGAILDAGWQSKKLTASQITSPEIDQVYDAAKAYGAFGGKVTGAGGGGFMMFLIDPARRDGLMAHLSAFGGTCQPARFYPHGVTSWVEAR